MSSHEAGGQAHGTKTEKKKRARLDEAADAAPQAKKQKQASAGRLGGTSTPMCSTAAGKGKTKQKKMKAADSQKQTHVEAARVAMEEQPAAAPVVSRKEAKLQQKSSSAATAGAAATAQPEAPVDDGARMAEGKASKRKGKKRKAAEAAETAGVAAVEGAVKAAASSAGRPTTKLKKKKKKSKHVQDMERGDPDVATGADAAVGNAVRKEECGQQTTAGAGATEEAPVPAAQRAVEQVAVGGAGSIAASGLSSGAGEADVASAGNRSGERPGKARSFQRVNADEWLNKKGARDNSYEATFGNGGWGAGAQAVLGQVRGKDFRHEKTKKKRGTYRGGQIDHNVNSFKFESDDE